MKTGKQYITRGKNPHIKVTCPYCGNEENKLEFTGLTKVVTCDVDNSDGCDQEFVVNMKKEVHWSTRKIESEEEEV